MAREPFGVMSEEWEPLNGHCPDTLLSSHPDGVFLAMEVGQTLDVAIWRTDTRKIFGQDPNVKAISWNADGTELLLLVSEYKHDPAAHDLGGIRIVSPLQSEFTHYLERYTWPAMERVDRMVMSFPMGFFFDIVCSPVASRAVVCWGDQEEAGIELVDWQSGRLHQLPDAGYFGESNDMAAPVFSPDGRFIVLAYGNGAWWVNEDSVDDSDEDFSQEDYLFTPSEGGEYLCGSIVIGDLVNGNYRSILLLIDVPEDWLPDDPSGAEYGFIKRPVFRDAETFVVGIGDLEERELSVKALG